MKRALLLFYIIVHAFGYAEHQYTITTSTIVPEKPVIVTFLLETSLKKIDDIRFDLSRDVSVAEYRIIPQQSGLFFIVTLIPHKAGTHTLNRVTLKSGAQSYTFEIGVVFTAEGVVTIKGTWKSPQSVYCLEPFLLELVFSGDVENSVYKAIGTELQKYCTAVINEDNKYMIIPSSQFHVPAFEINSNAIGDAVGAKTTVQTIIQTEPLEVMVKPVPAKTALVARDNSFTYRVKAQSLEYKTGDRVPIVILIQGAGIPLELNSLQVTIRGSNGYFENIIVDVNKNYDIKGSAVYSKITGTAGFLALAPGTYTVRAEPLSVFVTKTQKSYTLDAQELVIDISENMQNAEYYSTLKAFLAEHNDSNWALLLEKSHADYTETLQQLKKERYPWWSKEYAARIAFAMIAGDTAYAQYELLEAERKGFSLVLQLLYPVFTKQHYKLPHPGYVLVLLAVLVPILVFSVIRQKQKSGKISRALLVEISIMLVLLIVLGIAVYERTINYGITGDCPVYKVPDTESTTVALCNAGEVVKILTSTQSWHYIDKEGMRGWIETSGLRYTTR